MRFIDRRDAGRRLAAALLELGDETLSRQQPAVIALPHGGVPVAFEVARALRGSLDVFGVRKLGAPGNPELAVGAVAEDGTAVIDPRSAAMLGLSRSALDAQIAQESQDLRTQMARYRQCAPALSVGSRCVIVVDDGLATGLTDLAAVRALRKREPHRIMVAAPVASSEAIAMLEREADRVACVIVPRRLFGVGMWYCDFAHVTDEEVLAILARAASGAREQDGEAPSSDAARDDHDAC